MHAESQGRYGPPRVHAELASLGYRHARKRVARLIGPADCAAVLFAVACTCSAR